MSCLVTLLFLLFIAIALEPTFLIVIGLFLFVMTLIFFNSKNKIDKKNAKEEYAFQNKVENRDVSVTNVNNRKKYDDLIFSDVNDIEVIGTVVM